MWGGVSRSYSARGGSQNTRVRRAYPLVGSSPVPRIGGHSGPPAGPLPLYSWEGSVQLGTPRPVGPALCSGLGRSLGDPPPHPEQRGGPHPHHGLEPRFRAAPQRVVSVASRPMEDGEAHRLCTLGTAESLRRMLAEEEGVEVTQTNTVLTGCSIRQMGAAVPTAGPISPATHQRPPSPAPPHYGAGSGVMAAHPYGVGSGLSPASAYGAVTGSSAVFPSRGGAGSSPGTSHGARSGAPAGALYRATTGPSANPPCPSGPEYYAPEGGPGQNDRHGYTPCSQGY